jgi:purine/pyrimidine-nucleoside phosphorylase
MSSVEFPNVTVTAKANVYFDGKVVSHSLRLASGEKKTVGLIYPGKYHFGTQAPERMDIIAGQCQVQLDGKAETVAYGAGTGFDVPGESGFTIQVESGIAEYICSFR